MKAIVVEQHGGPEVLTYQDIPDPAPSEGEVLINVQAAAVNFADLLLREGYSYTGLPPPIIPGMDVAGTVVAVGPGVSSVRAGERVAASPGIGGYAGLAVAGNLLVWAVPDSVDLDTAAAFPTIAITAYNLLTLAGRLTPGETVLVHSAAGGVGTTATQLARILGAETIIGTVGDPARADLACSFGCDHVIVRSEEDFAGRALELTDGRGVDLILDPIAGKTLERGLFCLAPFGRLVAFGISSRQAGRVASDELHPANRAVVGYSTGSYRRLRPETLGLAAKAVLDLLAKGRLKLTIGSRFPLAEARAGHELIESWASVGKILLVP